MTEQKKPRFWEKRSLITPYGGKNALLILSLLYKHILHNDFNIIHIALTYIIVRRRQTLWQRIPRRNEMPAMSWHVCEPIVQWVWVVPSLEKSHRWLRQYVKLQGHKPDRAQEDHPALEKAAYH